VLRSTRAQRDDTLIPQVQRVWQANMQVYGADKSGVTPKQRLAIAA
jgi:hypothetical protein